MDDTLERIFEMSYSGVFENVDSFLEELREEIWEKADELKFEYDKMRLVCEASMEIAKENFDQIKSIAAPLDVTETDLLLYSAWKIACLIQQKMNESHAASMGDDYSSNPENIEEYGSKSHAYDKGYDNYMSDNTSFGYLYLNEIINIYSNTMSI